LEGLRALRPQGKHGGSRPRGEHLGNIDVSIASLDLSLPEMNESEKDLILLAQMRRENLREDLPQIFQSCTFNRSVTSPVKRSTN
jgi:hypothetical protein